MLITSKLLRELFPTLLFKLPHFPFPPQVTPTGPSPVWPLPSSPLLPLKSILHNAAKGILLKPESDHATHLPKTLVISYHSQNETLSVYHASTH